MPVNSWSTQFIQLAKLEPVKASQYFSKNKDKLQLNNAIWYVTVMLVGLYQDRIIPKLFHLLHSTRNNVDMFFEHASTHV